MTKIFTAFSDSDNLDNSKIFKPLIEANELFQEHIQP